MSERACEAAYGCTERGECYAETVGVQAHCGGVPSGSSVPEAVRAAAALELVLRLNQVADSMESIGPLAASPGEES